MISLTNPVKPSVVPRIRGGPSDRGNSAGGFLLSLGAPANASAHVLGRR